MIRWRIAELESSPNATKRAARKSLSNDLQEMPQSGK
jgi:hypothetical protein